MFKIIVLSILVSVVGASQAQERSAASPGVITSISTEGRELIVGQEIYFLPEQLKLDGLVITRAKVASLLQPGDEVMVELESGRTVKAIHSRLR